MEKWCGWVIEMPNMSKITDENVKSSLLHTASGQHTCNKFHQHRIWKTSGRPCLGSDQLRFRFKINENYLHYCPWRRGFWRWILRIIFHSAFLTGRASSVDSRGERIHFVFWQIPRDNWSCSNRSQLILEKSKRERFDFGRPFYQMPKWRKYENGFQNERPPFRRGSTKGEPDYIYEHNGR